MKLFDFSVRSYPSAYNLFLFQYSETRFDRRFSTGRLFYSKSRDSSKEYFEHGFHIVDKHFLEVSLLLSEGLVRLLLPHFEYDTFVDLPVSDMRIKILQ